MIVTSWRKSLELTPKKALITQESALKYWQIVIEDEKSCFAQTVLHLLSSFTLQLHHLSPSQYKQPTNVAHNNLIAISSKLWPERSVASRTYNWTYLICCNKSFSISFPTILFPKAKKIDDCVTLHLWFFRQDHFTSFRVATRCNTPKSTSQQV